MENTPEKAQNNLPAAPGFGIAGQVMCPHGFQKGLCVKQACELWVELQSDGVKVGRCSEAWKTIIATEQTTQLRRIADILSQTIAKKDE